MEELRRIEQDILTTGKVDSEHLEALHRQVYANGAIGRPEADFLVELHKRVQRPNPGFEELFYRAIKDHILEDDRIDAERVVWLRQVLFEDGQSTDEERKLLHELRGEAQKLSPEFEALFREAMKLPQ
jgi:hypothetical protein